MSNGAKQIRDLAVDDHPLLRQGFAVTEDAVKGQVRNVLSKVGR